MNIMIMNMINIMIDEHNEHINIMIMNIIHIMIDDSNEHIDVYVYQATVQTYRQVTDMQLTLATTLRQLTVLKIVNLNKKKLNIRNKRE